MSSSRGGAPTHQLLSALFCCFEFFMLFLGYSHQHPVVFWGERWTSPHCSVCQERCCGWSVDCAGRQWWGLCENRGDFGEFGYILFPLLFPSFFLLRCGNCVSLLIYFLVTLTSALLYCATHVHSTHPARTFSNTA